MKTKLKGLSKRSLSVLLVLLMVVSTVTVGIFTTTAAFTETDDSVGASVDADEAVGDSTVYGVKGAWDSWTEHDFNGDITINITSTGNYEFGFYKKVNGTQQWFIGGNKTITESYPNGNDFSEAGNSTLAVTTTGTYTFGFVNESSGPSIKVKILFPSNPVCSSLSLVASKNALSSETDTFTLTATATSLAATPVTYKIYRTGTTDPIATFSNTSETSVTTSALTQSDATSATYYATVEKSGYETKTSGNVTVTNNAVVETEDIYLYGNGFGYNGTWDKTNFTKLVYQSSTGYYYASHFVKSTDAFRVWEESNNATHRKPKDDSADVTLPEDGSQVATDSGWSDSNWFKFPSSTNGKTIKIYYDYTTKKLWIEVQKKVASSVALTINPSKTKLGNKIRTMTATVTGVDAGLTARNNITYTFKTGDTVIQTVTKKANETTCVITDIPSGDGTNFTTKTTYPITVEVSTTETYTDGSETKNYLPVSNTANVEFNDGNVYYTAGGVVDPADWDELNNAQNNTIALSSLAAESSFTFALSSEDDYVDGFPMFNLSQADNKYCTVTQSTYRVNRPTDDDAQAGFTVFTYTVTPLKGIKAGTTKLYIDLSVEGGKPVNKIYAQAEFDKTTGADSTFDHTSKTVKYYFAKMKSQNYAGTIDNRKDGTMWVHYWNNSVATTDAGKHGYAQGKPVKQDGTTVGTEATKTSEASNGTQIYLDASDLTYDNGGPKKNTNGFTNPNDDIFDVYEFELPVWATSVAVRGASGGSNHTQDYDVDSAKLITINPNRIYCFFSCDNAIRFSGVPLDVKFWDPMTSTSRVSDTYKNEASEKTFKVNVAKLNKDASGNSYWYKVNDQLHSAYNGTTSTGLYFGNFYDHSDAHWAQWDSWNNFNYTANIAMRWNDDSTNKADDYKYVGGCPYYASIWDLVGMHLKPVTTTTNGVTKTDYQLQNFDESATVPYFDYTWLSGSTNRAKYGVFKEKDFPFVASKYEGITTYSYDSQVDPNRAITNKNSGDVTKENFVNTHAYKKLGSMLGYAPFINYGNGEDNLGFVNEFKIEFNLTNTGSLKKADGTAQDIQFNFSGDDDVWVFVDGVLVLDLGGDHMPSAGSINFTDKKVYYKSAADSITKYPAANKFYGAADKNDFSTGTANVKTLDLEMILNAGSLTGEKFNFTDGATKHTLQMFYMERGENESNCSLSFNLPQASGLNIYNEVTANQVNPGLKAAAMLSANTDAFRYNVSVKQANDTEWNNVQSFYNLLASRKDPGSTTFLDSLPTYPSSFNAWREFTQSFIYNGATTSTTMKGKLSKTDSDTEQSSILTSIPEEYTTLAGNPFELNDNYIKTDVHDPVAGQTKKLAAAGYEPGDFNLLTGQKATFNNKVPANMMVQLYQNKALDEAKFNGNDNLITNNTVAMNDVYDYYTTTYNIYDNQLQYYVKDTTDATSTGHIYANDNSSNSNSFYFTNYSTDENVIDPAMTVNYYNDINVGKIKVQKVLGSNENATSEVEFNFKVYFKNIFGFDEDDAAYSHYTTYNEYPIVYHRYSTVDNSPVTGTVDDPDPAIPYDPVKGIRLRAGEYAIIEGVPVETQYKVKELSGVAGFSLSMIKKWAKLPGYENNSAAGDVLYKSRNSLDGSFNNKEIYYQRITVDTKELLVPPDTSTLTDQQIAENSTIDYVHKIPNGMIDGTTHENVTDDYLVNSIPIRSQTQYNGEYISTSWVQFTNQREGVQISFNYYPRVVVDGQPASISESPDTYTYTIEDLYEKDNQGNYKYVTMDDSDAVSAVLFNKMIESAMVNFYTYNAGVFRNVIDDYKFFTTQAQAESAFKVNGGTIENPGIAGQGKEITDYTKDNIKYHTNYYSQPITTNAKSDMWVSYFNNLKSMDNTYYVDAESNSTPMENIAAVKKVNVWLYNYPKTYKVRYASATENDSVAHFNRTGVYKEGYYVGNNLASGTLSFYYNQRFGGKAVDEDPQNPEVLTFLGPNEYGFPSYTNQEVQTASEVTLSDSNQKLKFLYWAFDPYGYSKASEDIRYNYRVSTSFTLYPVYGTEEAYNEFKQTPGLSVSMNGEDSYFDTNGNARRRLNVLMSPYNCPNDDPNIYSTAVVYVTLDNSIKNACTVDGELKEQKVNEFYQKYRSQLAGLLSEKNVVGTSLGFTADNLSYTLTTKGFKHDVNPEYGTYSPIALTNKNRVQFATRFTVNPTTANPNGITDCFAIAAAMLYHNEDGNNTWITSDNTAIYDFGKELS